MKAITYVVNKHGRGYVQTTLVPANHSENSRVNPWGLVIASGLLLMTVVLLGSVLFALLK